MTPNHPLFDSEAGFLCADDIRQMISVYVSSFGGMLMECRAILKSTVLSMSPYCISAFLRSGGKVLQNGAQARAQKLIS